MSDFTLTRQSITSGTYCGTLKALGRINSEPVLEMRLLDTSLGPLSVKPDPSKKRTWHITAEVPSSAINESVQTIIIHDLRSGETLDSFALIAGIPLQDDLRAEITLLRAELDLLKSAFRRHCAAKSS